MKTSVALVKLIVFIVVTSILTLFLAATIGNLSFGGKKSYHAMFTDVTGLLSGNDVRIAGVKVGQVDGIELKDNKVADVSFSLADGRTVARSAVIQLRYRNLVGERYLAVTEAPGSDAPLKTGSTIPQTQTRNALDLTVLFNGFRPLFQALDPTTVNAVAFEIVQTLQGEGGTVESLLQKTASLTNSLADKDAVIGRVIDNLTTVLATVDDRGNELNNLVLQLKGLTAGFAQDRTAIGASIAGISDLTSATSSLLADVRPPLKQDIGQIRTLATTLDDNKQTVNGVLQRLPTKLDRIIGTATYGSWFNFYLCGFDGRVIIPAATVPGQPPLSAALPQFVNSAARCQK